MKGLNNITLAALFVLVLSGIVSASGVASVYNSDNPLYLQPGESKVVQYSLQNACPSGNCSETSDLTYRAQVVNGTSIAVLTDSNLDYEVPAGTTGSNSVLVNMKVTAPASAKPGDKFDVRVSFTSVSPGEKGQFAFGSAFEQHFNVIIPAPAPVASSSSSSGMTITYLVIAIIVILAIILYAIKRNKD